MAIDRIPAVFIRGGTSNGVFFHERDLPKGRAERDAIFLTVIGSPDPYHRQLNGMGGGYSSVSKVVVIAPSERPDADVDYTFFQIGVDKPVVDDSLTCGNLSSSVGPFAVDEGLVEAPDGEAVVRVFNTNTNKRYEARFEVRSGRTVEVGDYTMAGVPGTGAKITLDYLDPGGAGTGRFLPTGEAIERLDVPGIGPMAASLIDASNPTVFVDASALGVQGTETPDALDANAELMARLEQIRLAGALRMGMAERVEDVTAGNPKVALIAPPRPYTTIGGADLTAKDFDVSVRIVSMERIHKAVTGTGGMCLAAACRVEDSIPNRLMRAVPAGQPIRIGTPSGVMPVGAEARRDADGIWQADSITVYRTQRRLMDGTVRLPFAG